MKSHKVYSIQRYLMACLIALMAITSAEGGKKKVYITYVLHGNMNYDRYVRPTIWREFPIIYDNLLDFMDEHPDFKGQLQFSGQTFGSLQQAAPEVIQHALRIHQRGQLNLTGTFYSEPVNVNMDGETNYRCAWLGTRIIEDNLGEKTDGFYLQERAYHSQLPWILKNAGVSWTPIITNDDSWFPFRLRGQDGTLSVCVPITRERSKIGEQATRAPKNALICIEEDYEIPQSFTSTYQLVADFNKESKDVEIIWITVKEYIKRFGVKEEKYVDHSAKALSKENGTYSRWTADPLDIILQDQTNQSMKDFRAAKIVNALAREQFGVRLDEPFLSSDVTLPHSALTWNIERADLYPDIETRYLARDGEVTLLSKAEHLLLWAVNSDSKGWYPLYEKRCERLNSFQGSSTLSKAIIQKGMNLLCNQMKLNGYDQFYLLLNLEPERTKEIQLETDAPYDLFDYTSGEKLPSQCTLEEGRYRIQALATLPSYGYMVVGAKQKERAQRLEWTPGTSISQNGITLTAQGDHVQMKANGRTSEIRLAPMKVKVLAEMNDGKGDDAWRPATPYGEPRIQICTNGLWPQLRIETQLDWLIHLQEIFTIENDKVSAHLQFVFPHPTLVRGQESKEGFSFNPEGLDLIIQTGKTGFTAFDIPFGINEYKTPGVGYFCPLSSLWLQQEQGGLLVSPQTGEQAFCVDSEAGTIRLYMGSSTTSGPIRDVGLTFRTPTDVQHELAWYAEPFHGTYHHEIILYPYQGTWQEAHLPQRIAEFREPVYTHLSSGSIQATGETLPTKASLASISAPNVEITTMDYTSAGLQFRMNEREGKKTQVTLQIAGKTYQKDVPAFGIVEGG